MSFNTPIFIQWNDEGQLIENELKVITTNGITMLEQIPDKAYKVYIEGDMVEIKNENPITNPNQYKCDYRTGTLYFHISKVGQQINIRKYLGRGVIMYPASRIFDSNTGEPVNTTKSLQDYINSVLPFGDKGDYDVNVIYEPNSIVSYEKGIYRCKQTAIGIIPTNTTYWHCMASVKTEADYAKAQGDYAKASADGILFTSEDFTPETITVDNDIAPLVKNELNRLDTQLADIVTSASTFKILATNDDNYNNIITALDYIKSKGGGTLQLPSGVFKTSPISFQGYDNIVIKGIGRSVPYTTATTIKIVGTNPAGSVGLQFADTTNPNPTWSAKFCRVEGLFVECDNKVDVGINGNLGLSLHDVMVRRARVDGIVLEDYTYPVYITQSASQYNGRHGFYVKGKMSTAYSIYQSEFSYNNGYGICLEGGASDSFRDCFAQGNKRGGIKVNYINGYGSDYYLENINFKNIYTEANGTLLETDPNYEGNYALYITGYEKTNNALLKPKIIKYTGTLNASETGKALKIDAVYGFEIDANISGLIDIASVGVMGVEFATSPTVAAVPNIESGNALTSYYNLNSPVGKIYNGLHYSKRGNVHVFEFKLNSILAGQSKKMDVSYTGVTGLSNGYKAIREGSIISIGLYKGNNNGTVNGTLAVRPVQGNASFSLFNEPTVGFNGFTNMIVSSNEIQKKASYPIGQFGFVEDTILGLEVVASSDYQAGYNTALVGYIVVEW